MEKTGSTGELGWSRYKVERAGNLWSNLEKGGNAREYLFIVMRF